MSDDEYVPHPPKPWLSVRFEYEIKGLPPGFYGLNKVGYTLGTYMPTTLAEALIGITTTGAQFYLDFMELHPEHAERTIHEVADELQKIVDVLRQARVTMKDQPDGSIPNEEHDPSTQSSVEGPDGGGDGLADQPE